MPESLLSAKSLAEMLGVPLGTIYRWNHRGDGPLPLHIGRHVRYRVADVESWIEAHAWRGPDSSIPRNAPARSRAEGE
jgi:excisionase family DNA binding protein